MLPFRSWSLDKQNTKVKHLSAGTLEEDGTCEAAEKAGTDEVIVDDGAVEDTTSGFRTVATMEV